MKPIPEAAILIRDYIRENVPRPEELPFFSPTSVLFGLSLRFSVDVCCPMGLVDGALRATPSCLWHFAPKPPWTNHEIHSFAYWWDSLTDPQTAVDAVWGNE